MNDSFVEMITFQVKPDKLTEFEEYAHMLKAGQAAQPGCLSVRYFKRFYTFDGVESGEPPRELTKIVKCVKYFSYWEFDSIENCGKANGWLFENHLKSVSKLLIIPFELNSGYSL